MKKHQPKLSVRCALSTDKLPGADVVVDFLVPVGQQIHRNERRKRKRTIRWRRRKKNQMLAEKAVHPKKTKKHDVVKNNLPDVPYFIAINL